MARVALVAVPYIFSQLHRLYAEAFVKSIRSSHDIDRIAIVNAVRSSEDEQWLREHFHVVEHNDRNILARAWNRGIRLAFERGATYVLVANLDVVFHPWCIDNLVECAEQESSKVVWSPVFWHDPTTFSCARLEPVCIPGMHWSCFMVDRRLRELVGEFDEGFEPAYLEDADMAYRMTLLGFDGATCRAAVALNHDRGTIKGLLACDRGDLESAANLLRSLRVRITKNDERYIRKWGGTAGYERFVVPFDGAGDEERG